MVGGVGGCGAWVVGVGDVVGGTGCVIRTATAGGRMTGCAGCDGAVMANVTVVVAVLVLSIVSVAVMVMLADDAWVGVPVMMPVFGSRLKPEGNVPWVTA